MKRAYLLVVCLLIFGNVYSQTQTGFNVDINDVYTPNSPGFVLLDKSPNSVDKPTTNKAFSASLLNLTEGGAVQATPYWFKSHPNYTCHDIYKHTVPFYETLNFSAATVKTDSNYIFSVGVRVQVLRLYSKHKRSMADDQVSTLVYLLTPTPGQLLDTTVIKKALDKYSNQISKPTFDLEFAFASAGSTSNFSSSRTDAQISKSGVWMNACYNNSYALPFEIVGVARYIWAGQQNSKSDSSYFDYGVGLFFSKNKFDISGEYLWRHDYALAKLYNRASFAVNYKISNSIIAVMALGKNFDNVENLFSTIGLNFGLANKKVQVATEK